MNYIHTIQQYLPHLQIESFQVETRGWDNIGVIINNEWLFRFPRTEQSRKRIERDGKLLERLHKELDICVPLYNLLHDQRGNVFGCYYKLIDGNFLTKELLHSLEKQEVVAEQIATFMATLHRVDVAGLNYHREHDEAFWRDHFQNVGQSIFPLLTKHEQEYIHAYFSNIISLVQQQSTAKSIIHGDISYTHILYKNGLHGVIDFGDACIGDPAYDFYRLYADYGATFARLVYNYYKEQTPFPNDETFFERMDRYYQHHAVFHELLYNLKIGHKKGIHQNLQTLREKIPFF
ncbi:hypothetical protein BAMA_10760 [Bacillus manliponensis]|uniref:Aminoglycoside phosphotransferase domain-containing protein n=1 Tax=Bacillus manliponensis TaxID=574376 RepID=A0A073JRV9_9BACI|nr:aminoglycoside phosphotransferase family protein [Bacillus manliponensis]KEK17829.1 hypothetical protein BAMA_10760 [Bacillus manliponensis]